MIHLNELRINNWVLLKDTPFKIISCAGIDAYHNLVSPIPLTPEILLNNGFKQNGESSEISYTFYKELKTSKDSSALSDLHLIQNDFGFGVYQTEEHPVADRLMYIHIANVKYVHQLQNLIFSLTGQEWEVNL